MNQLQLRYLRRKYGLTHAQALSYAALIWGLTDGAALQTDPHWQTLACHHAQERRSGHRSGLGVPWRCFKPDCRFAAVAGAYGARGPLMGKPYKRQKRGAGRHVQLPEWVQVCEAWATLKPGPRALYIELKRRYNGTNNGGIILSHRDAAKALNVTRNTIGPWFVELNERGFISMTQAPHLGPSGIGKASVWALDEMPTPDAKPARTRFMRWTENKTPAQKTGHGVPKNGTRCPKKRDSYRR